MKVCIICIARNEDKYIREWIDYHLSIGIDKIFICNNDDNQEILAKYNCDKVQVIDYHGVEGIQPIAYTAEFKRLKSEFDWLIFIDVDEFIVLENYLDIKEFLSLDRFKKCDCIKLNWKIFDDNELIDVVDDDYSVMKRFTESIEHEQNHFQKAIIKSTANVRGRICGHGYYSPSSDYISVNSLGNRVNNTHLCCKHFPIIHSECWINHYPTKSIGEYIRQKYFRGGPNRNPETYSSLNHFWKYNKKTDEKEKYAKELIDEMLKEGFTIRKPRVYRTETGKLVKNEALCR